MKSRDIISLIVIALLLTVAILVVLPGSSQWLRDNIVPKDPDTAEPIRTMDFVYGLDLNGGVQALLEVPQSYQGQFTQEELATAQRILESRTNALGVSENVFQVAGERRIVAEFPGLGTPDRVIAVIKEVGQLEFVDLGDNVEGYQEGDRINTDLGLTGGAVVEETEPAEGGEAQTPPTDTVYHTVMTGDQLNSVGATTDQLGRYIIQFDLKSDGARTFADFTSRNIGKVLAIVLDKTIISAPYINAAITEGSGLIEGNFDYDSANALAVQMRYGALPIPFEVVQSRVIQPTLGQDSLDRSIIAGVIGFAIVILFMAIYYRLPGFVAILSILTYAVITLALFKLIPVTLTLPGIAGFLLSTGSALDANILFFERLKEELRAGRTFGQAAELGWKRAWPSIRDSNIATLITCAILFWFGSSLGATIVKGFAFTLAIGVGVSLFCAFFVTRTFLNLAIEAIKPSAKHLKWFGIYEQ